MLLLLIWQTTKMQAKHSPHVIPNKNQINELINKNFTTHNGISNILIAILITLISNVKYVKMKIQTYW